MSRQLAEADQTNAGWQRDLLVSFTKMAEFFEGQGDRAQALPYAQQSLAVAERLAALDPTNATWQNHVKFARARVTRLRG